MSELKACPFCNVNEWKYQSHFSGTTIYQCEKCGTIVEEWVINTRPIEDSLQAENEWLKEELQQEKTRSQLNLEAEERRMLNITYYCAEIDRLNARIAELKELLDTESQLSNQFYLLLVDNPKSKKLADDLIEALRINGKEVQG